jgi:glycosyltransferase involved in cell wall biosynthesis
MKSKVCFVYPWATFGGVERILINRAIAFRESSTPLDIHLYFQHDAGGLDALEKAICSYGLSDNLKVVPKLEGDMYDAIGVIDCPDIVSHCHQRKWTYFVECHTAYPDNQRYLKNLPPSCAAVCVPSEHFKSTLMKHYPHLKTRILRNFVPNSLSGSSPPPLPLWPQKPILFLGRLDSLKNPIELLDAFKIIHSHSPDQYLLMICGTESPEIDINKEIKRRNLFGKVLKLPSMPFNHTGNFMTALGERGGVFVSSSRAESFGLSAAEAIAFNMRVILSDIPAHRSLVLNNENHLYQLGSPEDLAEKISIISKETPQLQEAKIKLSMKQFLKDWHNFWGQLQ